MARRLVRSLRLALTSYPATDRPQEIRMTRTLRPSLVAAACTALLAFAIAAGASATTSGMKAFRGGDTAALRGLPIGGTQVDLALVNLSRSEARCSLALSSKRGERLAPAIGLTLAPLESRPFLDALEDLPELSLAGDAQAAVSCDHAFSAFGVLSNAAAGRFEVVVPGAAAEQEAAALAALPAPDVACSAGAACFDAPGLVHEPRPPGVWHDAVGRVAFPAPAGVAKRFRLSLDVALGDWYPAEPSGKHLIYWFVVQKNIDMPGLLYFRGPGKDEAFARHGVGLTHPNKIKIIKPFAAQPDHTYRVVEDYDMTTRAIRITVTDVESGAVEVTLTGQTNVDSYTVRPGQKFLVDMGFYPGKVPTEVPSYGWRYSNVHVEVFLRR